MKFFNWMQNRFSSNNAGLQAPPRTQTCNNERRKHEFSDRAAADRLLLAIGTFGNTNPSNSNNPAARKAAHNRTAAKAIKIGKEEDEDEDDAGKCSSPPDLAEFTPEEFGKLHKALTKLLSRKPLSSSSSSSSSKKTGEEEDDDDDDVDSRLSNTTSSSSNMNSSSSSSSWSANYYECGDDEEMIDRAIRAIIGRCRDELCETAKKKKKSDTIGKKSFSFLAKKIFACRSRFSPAPSLRDTFQESRMEKLLKTMLSKKIYPQSSSRAQSKRRYLPDKVPTHEEEEEKARDSGKWDKTDSEYIVLEI